MQDKPQTSSEPLPLTVLGVQQAYSQQWLKGQRDGTLFTALGCSLTGWNGLALYYLAKAAGGHVLSARSSTMKDAFNLIATMRKRDPKIFKRGSLLGDFRYSAKATLGEELAEQVMPSTMWNGSVNVPERDIRALRRRAYWSGFETTLPGLVIGGALRGLNKLTLVNKPQTSSEPLPLTVLGVQRAYSQQWFKGQRDGSILSALGFVSIGAMYAALGVLCFAGGSHFVSSRSPSMNRIFERDPKKKPQDIFKCGSLLGDFRRSTRAVLSEGMARGLLPPAVETTPVSLEEPDFSALHRRAYWSGFETTAAGLVMGKTLRVLNRLIPG